MNYPKIEMLKCIKMLQIIMKAEKGDFVVVVK